MLPANSYSNNINQQAPSIFENDNTAAADAAKFAAKILPPDVMVPFQELGKQDLWKTSSNSGFPVLPPLSQNRTSEEETGTTGFEQAKNQTMNSLSDGDVKNGLVELCDTDPTFNALDQAVEAAALLNISVDSSVKLTGSEKAANLALINGALAAYMTDNMALAGQDIQTAAEQIIQETGPNTPQADGLLYNLGQFESALGVLNEKS